jgi:hypothetical protein
MVCAGANLATDEPVNKKVRIRLRGFIELGVIYLLYSLSIVREPARSIPGFFFSLGVGLVRPAERLNVETPEALASEAARR